MHTTAPGNRFNNLQLMKVSPNILVIGSANMDMVVSCERLARPGETILADSFGMYPGGKGANQAVACARLGGNVQLLCKMGGDAFQNDLVAGLERDGVGLRYLLTDGETPTGIALIAVDRDGQNEIIVASGSNMTLTADEVEDCNDAMADVNVVLLQLEIPLETVMRSAELAQDHGATVILNPAPAQELPGELLEKVDYLTPNEHEAERLTGMRVGSVNEAERAGATLLNRGVGRVLITMGAQGVVVVTREFTDHYPAHEVRAVDTTAAGDAFNGALALSLARGEVLGEAIDFANRVAALSVTSAGAQTSMPSTADLEEFLSAQAL